MVPPKRIILKSSSNSGTTNSSVESMPALSSTKKRPSRRAVTNIISPPIKRHSTRQKTLSSSPRPSFPRKTRTTSIPSDTSSMRLSEDDSEEQDMSVSDGPTSILEEEEGMEGDEEDRNQDKEEEQEDEEEEVLLSGVSSTEEASEPKDGKVSDEFSSSSSLSDSESESISALNGNTQSNRRLTSRQRTLLEAETLSPSPSLDPLLPPSLNPKELTEEEQLRRSEKSRRRMMQRDQKLEQSKAETIQRLLQKQSSRSRKMKNNRLAAGQAPDSKGGAGQTNGSTQKVLPPKNGTRERLLLCTEML